MPLMNDSPEGQTQYDEEEMIRSRMLAIPQHCQDEALIRHYAALAMVAMQGIRAIDEKRAWYPDTILDERIKHIADMLRKAQLDEFGCTVFDGTGRVAK